MAGAMAFPEGGKQESQQVLQREQNGEKATAGMKGNIKFQGGWPSLYKKPTVVR